MLFRSAVGLHDDVAEMKANADVNLFGRFLRGVMSEELSLDGLGALYGMDDRGEIDQEGVAEGFDDMAMMSSDSLFQHLVMHGQQPERAVFVRAHLTAEADDKEADLST